MRELIGGRETKCALCVWFYDKSANGKGLFVCVNDKLNPSRETWQLKDSCHCTGYKPVSK